MPQKEYFYYRHHHRQPWPGGTVVSRLGMPHASAADPCQGPQVNRMADLPTLLMQRIIGLLDHGSCLELRKVDKRCRQAVDGCWRLVCIPLDHLKRHSMKHLSKHFTAAGCLVVAQAEQRISLSVLGHRRRCEQLLAVFLDNTALWSHLVALDLSQALVSMSANCLELLTSSLSSLQHLALPKVAASTEFAHAPAHEVLHLISSMQYLRSLELDCTLLVTKTCNQSSSSPCGQPNLPAASKPGHQQGSAHLFSGVSAIPILQYPGAAAHVAALNIQEHGSEYVVDGSGSGIVPSSESSEPQQPIYSSIDDASSTCIDGDISSHGACIRSNSQQEFYGMHMCNPWFQLHHMLNLQQLQLVNPSNLQDLLPALGGLRNLVSLSLGRVQQSVCTRLLDPGSGSSHGQGLGTLHHLKLLTRLELGLEQPCSSCNGSAVLPSKLVIPPHSTSDSTAHIGTALASAAVAAAYHCQHFSCCWSHLQQLKVLVLSGVCLDCPLVTATAECTRLTELRVAGIVLEHEIHLAVLQPLHELKVLSVSQRFDLGGNNAAALFPGLTKLIIRDGSKHCPDFSCLKHHATLSSLFIEAAGQGWQLSQLQLGHLVHVTSLQQLSLASRWCGGSSGHHHHPLPHQQVLTSPGRGGVHKQHVPLPRVGLAWKSPSRGGLSCSNSAHWLPSASLTQVTSLTLSGPCNDLTLSQLPNQFPAMMSLQLLGSYYASDQGLKRLCRAPHLSALLLDGCDHVTEYGIECIINTGSIRMLVVQGCGGVDERACQRIRRACRNSCTCLHWHGTDGSRGSSGGLSNCSSSGHISPYFDMQDTHHHHHHHHHHHSHHARSSSNSSLDVAIGGAGAADVFGGCDGNCSCSSGSVFLERCWQEVEAEKASNNCKNSNTADIHGVASFTFQQLTDTSTSTCSQVTGALDSSTTSSSSSSQDSHLADMVQEELGTLHLESGRVGETSPAGEGCKASMSDVVCASLATEAGIVAAQQQLQQQKNGTSHATQLPVGRSSAGDGVATTAAVAAAACTEGRPHGLRRNSESCTCTAAASLSDFAVMIDIARSSSSGADGGAASSRTRHSSCVARAAASSWPRHSHPGQAAAH